MLGHLEVEKFSLFSGRSVEKYEAVVVNGDSHVKCWRVLIPLKIAAGHDAAIELLEKMNS